MNLRQFARRIACLVQRDQFTQDLQDEMRLHVELRARKLHQQGLAPGDAEWAARRQFGNLASYQDTSSELWGWNMWERCLQDVRQGARGLAKSRGFTLIAVITLAIGIGMNTAVFSIVDGVMLRPLPYPHPERLMALLEKNTVTRDHPTVSIANMADYRQAAGVEALAAYTLTPMTLTGTDRPERLLGETVTANFFQVLGILPARGRTFLPEEETPEGASSVIVTDEFWRKRMNGAAGILDRSILLDSRLYRIVGVLPRGFQSPAQMVTHDRIEFYVPPTFPKELLTSRGDHEVSAVARLRAAVPIAIAQQQLSAISTRLGKEYPDSNAHIRASLTPLRADIVQGVSDSLWILLGASALIVLIACANVANLLLIRTVSRRHESSIRLALGASRARIVMQSLVESLLLSITGCAAGVGLGSLLMKALISLAPPNTPRIHDVSLDWTVFAVAAGIAIMSGLVFGLSPAWQASHANPARALGSGSRGTVGKSQAYTRLVLTVAEVALSVILLVGAGLLLRSFMVLMGVDLGFRPDHVIAMSVNLPKLRYPTKQDQLRFFEQLEQRAGGLPGVRSVAFANRFPMRGGWGTGVYMESAPTKPLSPNSQSVSVGYFDTLGITLVRGRLLSATDREGNLPVCDVNETFVREYLQGQDAIGLRMRRNPTAPLFTVVGVVHDIRRGGKQDKINPEIYLSAAQTGLYPVALADFALRTAGDPRLLVNAVQAEVLAIDKDQPITSVRTMQEIVDRSVADRRFNALLLIVFAGVAVSLAVIGVYSVLAYSVAQRRQELGIRVALGAEPIAVVALILKQALGLLAVGLAIGLAGAWMLSTYLQSLLFEVKPGDWRTYLGATALLAVVGIAASLIPALRGARVDPVVALRAE